MPAGVGSGPEDERGPGMCMCHVPICMMHNACPLPLCSSSARETALGRAHCSASSSAGAEAAHRIFACVSLRLLVLRKLWHLVIRHVQQAADPSQELLSKHVCLLRLRIAPRWISGRSRNCAPVCSSPLPLAVAGWQVAALLVLIYAYK